MDDHLYWIEHEGQKILYMNFQYCDDEKRIEISKVAIKLIAAQELNSVRLLTDVNHTVVSVESMRAVKQDWIDVDPHILKTSIIGIKGAKSVLIKIWYSLTNSSAKLHRTYDDAIHYLSK